MCLEKVDLRKDISQEGHGKPGISCGKRPALELHLEDVCSLIGLLAETMPPPDMSYEAM